MALARLQAVRTLHTSLRHGTFRLSAPARTQLPRQLVQAGQRRWQSGDSHAHEGGGGSELPWALGAVAVTIPGVWFLWPEAHHADAGHHDSHEEKPEEESGEKEEEAPQEEAPAEESSEKPAESEKQEESKEGGESDKKEDSKADEGSGEKEDSKENEGSGKEEKSESDGESDKDGDSKDEKASSEPAEGESKDGPQFKGKMKEDAEGQSDSRKVEPMPPSKGTNKKRIDSGYQKDLGGGDAHESAATAKPTGQSQGDISVKQKGMANTETRHSTQIDEDPDKSKKAEGTPETAKSMGTVDPSRPAK